MDERFFDRNAMKIHKYQSKRIVGCWLLLWSLTTANWSTIGHANNVIAIGPRGSRDSNFVHIFGRNDTSPVWLPCPITFGKRSITFIKVQVCSRLDIAKLDASSFYKDASERKTPIISFELTVWQWRAITMVVPLLGNNFDQNTHWCLNVFLCSLSGHPVLWCSQS